MAGWRRHLDTTAMVGCSIAAVVATCTGNVPAMLVFGTAALLRMHQRTQQPKP
jgi:hypothetical protein